MKMLHDGDYEKIVEQAKKEERERILKILESEQVEWVEMHVMNDSIIQRYITLDSFVNWNSNVSKRINAKPENPLSSSSS